MKWPAATMLQQALVLLLTSSAVILTQARAQEKLRKLSITDYTNPEEIDLQTIDNVEKVNIDVYSEILCPDCMQFMMVQLSPVWEELKSILNVDIFPYGNAKDKKSPGGGYTFQCQHGQKECHGNMILACAKKYITDRDTYVDFNICMEENIEDLDVSGEKCALTVGVAYHSIRNCAQGMEGQQLLHDIGVITKRLTPPHQYVPWIVVDGIHSEQIENASSTDLKSYVCKVWKGVPPAACISSLVDLEISNSDNNDIEQ